MLLGLRGPVKALWGSAYDEYAEARMDPVSGSIIFMDAPHSEIHEQNSYSAFFSNTTASSDEDRSVIGFKTMGLPDRCHLVISIRASSPANFVFLEGPTLDLGEGSEVTQYNRDRSSSETSGVFPLTVSPTAGQFTTFTEAQIAGANLSGGTQITGLGLAGGEGPLAVGGVSRGTREWVLNPNTIYLFYLQNVGANANLHNINVDWYEHADVY
jgi:hypothetical protein